MKSEEAKAADDKADLTTMSEDQHGKIAGRLQNLVRMHTTGKGTESSKGPTRPED